MSGPGEKVALDFTALAAAPMQVRLSGDRVVAVRPLSRVGYEAVKRFTQTNDPMLLWDIAALALPDATQDEINALSAEQVAAVLYLVQGRVSEAQDALKPSLPPAGEAAAATPSNSPMMTATSSPVSGD